MRKERLSPNLVIPFVLILLIVVVASLQGATSGKVPASDQVGQKTNYELLQGKWQCTDDKTNFVIFEKNHKKEFAEGMEEWEDEEFVLTDSCMNNSGKNPAPRKEKDRYISYPSSNLCCYLLKLDATTLSISYMGRGNTLNYKRVK